MNGIAAHDTTRLTSADLAAIDKRMRESLNNLGHGERQSWMTDPRSQETLERIGALAIGCCAADLRDSELATIAQIAAAVFGGGER